MTAIGKGDWVVVVKSCHGLEGSVFRCTGVSEAIDCLALHGPCGGIFIDGHPSGQVPRGGWALCCFKPISGGELGMFADLLNVPSTAPREHVAA